MPAILAFLGVAATWLGRIGLLAFSVSEISKFVKDNEGTLNQSRAEASNAGFTETDQQKIIAATTYEQVERNGQNPNDFWAGLSPAEKQALQFSPETLQADMGRTSFLGMSSAVLFAASLFASGVAAVKGIPVLLKTLSQLRDARAAGASALELMTIIEQGKIAGIAKVWVPGLIASFAAAGGWLTNTMTGNLNDATLWGRIFLGQAADDFAKANKSASGGFGSTSSGGSGVSAPRTIIRIVEDKKPEQFIGTLFSSKLGRADSFERKLDDEITDMDDLREDVKLNLNRWLASLPARMGYSVVVRKDPVDEFGSQQSGIWATLTIFMTHISGKTTPIDTILLGPVNPQTRLILQKTSKTVENEIAGFIDASTVTEIQVPNGTVDIFTPDGERTTLSDVKAAGASTSANGGASVKAPTSTSKGEDGKTRSSVQVVTAAEAAAKRAEQAKIDALQKGITPEMKAGPAVQPYRAERPIGKKLDGVLLYEEQLILSYTPGSTLNLRKTPGIDGAIIAKLPDATRMGVRGTAGFRDGYYWLSVEADLPGGGRDRGYVAEDFIKNI